MRATDLLNEQENDARLEFTIKRRYCPHLVSICKHL